MLSRKQTSQQSAALSRPRCGTAARTSSSACADSRSDTGLFRQALVARARQPRSRASYAQEGAGIGITRESAGVFDKLVEEAIAGYDRIIGLDLSEVAVDGSLHKAPCGGEGTGPNPTDSAKIVAVWRDGDGLLYVLPPCGRCREFIRQVDPANLDTEVILGPDRSALLRELLPAYDWPEPLASD